MSTASLVQIAVFTALFGGPVILVVVLLALRRRRVRRDTTRGFPVDTDQTRRDGST